MEKGLTPQRRWTKQEVEILSALVKERASNEEITQALGRNLPGIRAKICREKIQGKYRRGQWTPSDIAFLEEAVSKGIPPEEIAQSLARTKAAVITRAQASGLRYPHSCDRKNWKPEELKELKKLREQGVPAVQIAEILNRAQSSVWAKLRQLKVKPNQQPKQKKPTLRELLYGK